MRSSELNCKCEQCGKSMHKAPSQLKSVKHTFCCRTCQNKFQAHERSKKYSNDLNVTCPYCDKKFHKKLSHSKCKQHFCSMDCRLKYRESQRVTRVCEVCGKKFTVIKSQADAKYCSVECHNIYQRRFYKTVKCAHCGKEIQITKTKQSSSKTGLFFCSNKCVGKYFSGKNSPTYKGTLGVHRILRVYFESKQRERVYIRDKGICQICGKRAHHVHHKYPLYKMIENFCDKHPDIDITKNCYYVAKLIINEIKEFKDLNNLVSLCKSCHSKQHGGRGVGR